jgi:putative chitinase
MTDWDKHLNDAMQEFGIESVRAQAAFLATIGHESADFTDLVENLNYSADALCRIWPKKFSRDDSIAYARSPMRIANRAYANRNGNGDESSGDGARYIGRGLIQITGRANYDECGHTLGLDLVANPDLLLEPENAARSAAWYFALHGCAELADAGDFRGVSGVINCGNAHATERQINGWADRVLRYECLLNQLNKE